MSKHAIEWDAAKYHAFIDAYTKATLDDQETFIFDGTPIYTPYAKYLIEWLSDKVKAE